MPIGGVITTGSSLKFLWPGLKGIWGRQYKEWKPQYTDLFNKVDSDKNYEEYVSVTGFGLGLVKSQGGSVQYDSESQGWIARGTNITYGLGYIVTMEEQADNLYAAVAKRRTAMLGWSMRQAKEQNGALVYNRAFTAGFVGADGVTLASTAHPNISGGSFANTPAVSADLSEASLEDAMINIFGFQNDRGLFCQVIPKCLIVPRQEWFNANRILKSVYQAGTANNDLNILRATNALPDGIKMNVYLTAPHAWFVRNDVDGGGTGMIFQERTAIQFEQDNDFDTRNFKAMAWERYCFLWDDPRALWAVNGP
jgi:hypothetical protein